MLKIYKLLCFAIVFTVVTYAAETNDKCEKFPDKSYNINLRVFIANNSTNNLSQLTEQELSLAKNLSYSNYKLIKSETVKFSTNKTINLDIKENTSLTLNITNTLDKQFKIKCIWEIPDKFESQDLLVNQRNIQVFICGPNTKKNNTYILSIFSDKIKNKK